MDIQKSLAYLLLYAANIDTHIDTEEKEIIKSKLDSKEEWKEVKKLFEGDSDYERTEKVTKLIEGASDAQKNLWLNEVKSIMQADGDFSVAERYLLKLLGHI